MRTIIFILFSFICRIAVSQNETVDLCNNHGSPFIDHVTGLTVYDNPEIQASYHTGNHMILRDLAEMFSNKNNEYDQSDFLYTIRIAFVVTSDGNVTGARIAGKEFDELNSFERHVIRYVEKHLSGKWIPAKVNRQNISQLYLLRIVI